jgi:hypothetical protein
MPNYFDSDKYLFILANEGAGGHRLGRIVSCINNVYWYTGPTNGKDPWDIFSSDGVAGKNISPYHYDRLVEDATVPLVGERIERWWNPGDISHFYNHVWANRIKNQSFQTVMETQYLHWILHDTPEVLHRRFPNAKFISLIDNDIDTVTERYLETTAKFPVNLKMADVRPKYLNQHAKLVKAVSNLYKNPTEKDLWDIYNIGSKKSYRDSVRARLEDNNKKRSEYTSNRYLKVSWESFDPQQIVDFLKADSIDDQWNKLLNIK